MSKREPNAIGEWRKYLRFWGRDVQRDIDDELRFHLDMRERDLIADGRSAADAHDETLRRFGSVQDVTRALRAHDHDRERSRARVEVLGTLMQDVKYGTRKLWQSPAFSLAVILVLALGIGVNSAIFSAVDAALLRPLPFKDAERLAVLSNVRPPSEMRINGVPAPKRAPDLNDVLAMRDVVESVAGYAPGGLNLSGIGSPVRVDIALATTNLFATFGVRPALGRAFTRDEGDGKSPDVVVISHSFWRTHFGGDSGIVGKSVLLNNSPFTVVGVMPDKFAVPAGTDVWLPMQLPFRWGGVAGEALRQYLPLQTIVKLAPGVDAITAGKRIFALFAQYNQGKPPLKFTAEDVVQPLQETIVKSRRTALLVLMGAAGLVLLTACANVTNLLLARAATRRREFDIRASLGATRRRIVQQLLTESVLLSVAGAALGIALAYGGLQVLTALLPAQLIAVAPPTIDRRVLGFSIFLASITGVLFGLWPALGAARRSSTNDVSSRRGSSYAATSRDGRALRSIFVISEMAFALMLLIGAGLMLRSFRALMQTDSGVQVNRVASMQLALSNSRYANDQALKTFYGSLLERLRRAPGITDAAVVSVMPLQGEYGIGLGIDVEGAAPDPERTVYPQYLRATPDYFRVMGIRMIAGRSMSESDNIKAPVVVINQALADTLWPGANAIGKRFALGVMQGDKPSYMTVVGVVANVRTRSLDLAPTPQMYLPFNDGPTSASAVIVRGNANAASLLTGLRSSMRAIDAEQPVYDLQMLEDAVSKTVAPRRTNTLLIALFGLLSVTLAAFGVYAVIGYGVAQRTREIGIRIALGAQVQSVVGMVVREGLILALFGVAIGLAGAWVLSRILESLLYGVSTRDPFTFIAAPVILIGITIAATLIPARAASRVDPVRAIRME